MKKNINGVEIDELDELYRYVEILEDRLEMIAKHLGVTDYIDSIGPILDEIDRLKGSK